MPSHSSKQHRFMEAIAHSPSFAKKAGVPQSVGKDYAAADKGKNFSKGGEMKESKAMVGKEVAFFKKKGAPKSMIKHEEAEMMKRGGKVRRMAQGGMGEYDPFARDIDYDKEKAQGADTVKRLKGLFKFGEKEAAPVEDSSSVRKPQEVKSSTTINRPQPVMPTPRVELPASGSRTNIAAEMEEREKGGERGSANKGPDYGDDSSSSTQIFKRSKPSLTSTPRRPVGIEKTVKKERVITEPSEKTSTGATFKSDLEGRLEQMKPTETKPKNKFGLASDETRESIRKGLGSFADFFNLSKRHEQEFGKKAAKGGPVKKMAMGGFTREADGVAKKGKTQGKVVKMASGGFVRSADGCAQRGKTKALQVKMSRGGKC